MRGTRGRKLISVVGALLAATGIAAAADPETECVVLVERVALYQEGHFNDGAHVIEWLEYGTTVIPGPVGDTGGTGAAESWCVKLEDGREGVMELGSFGWTLGVSEYNYVTIVDRVALYEKGHYGDGDYVMEWVEYGTRIKAGPVAVFGKGRVEFSLVKLQDGREGLMKTGSFGVPIVFEIIAEETPVYDFDEPGGKRICTLKKGDRVHVPEIWFRGDTPSIWGLIQTKEGVPAWVETDDVKRIPFGQDGVILKEE